MQPRLIFCDMDGTYLQSDKSVSEPNLALVDALARRGIGFVPCTGRMLSGIPAELAGHPQVRFAVCSMGATIVEFGKQGPRDIFEGGLEKDDVIALYRQIKDLPVQFDVFANGRSYAERERLAHIGEYPIDPGMMSFVLEQRVPVDVKIPTLVKKVDRVERLNLYYLGEADGSRVRAVLDGMPRLAYTSHDGCGLEVVNARLSKGTALRWLCRHLGVDPQETIAFGDGENDIPMLEAAGLGVAMANACDACRAHADLVTTYDNDHYGVARFIEEEPWQN